MAANGLSVVDACSETCTPTDQPGQVPLADPPQNASAAIASGGDAIATAGVLLAEASCRQTSALTDSPADATPCSRGCAGKCGDGHVGMIVLTAILAATALPAVANPYRASATGVAATSRGGTVGRVVGTALGGSPDAVAAGGKVGRVVGVAVGGPPAADATGAAGGTTTRDGHLVDIALALVAEQRVHGHFVPRLCSDAELRTEDPRLQ